MSARILVAGSADPDWFMTGGMLGAKAIRNAGTRQGRDIHDFERILDFGCGCGRVLHHWQGLTGVRIYGTDLQLSLLRECRRVLPFAHVAVNGPEPPLPFADQSFDLVYSLSVFTHLDERQQLLWRDEIQRILKPHGLWVVTTQGEVYLSKLSRPERQKFQLGDVICQRSEFRGLNLCQAFHPEEYVRHVFATGFSVIDYEPEGARGNPKQDLYVLRRDMPAFERVVATHDRLATDRNQLSRGQVRGFANTLEA
jgi:SAM-dependent methyltransferase